MESINNIVCPVCTLYLRPGITLESHLSSHPKQKVIEALIKASNQPPGYEKQQTTNITQTTFNNQQTTFPNNNVNNTAIQHTWHQPQTNSNSSTPQLPQTPAPQSVPNTNHSFIYQQFMSSSSGTQPILNVNPMAQHFVAVPTLVNPQMFCSPYVFHQAQQQLQIVTANPQMVTQLPRQQPVGLLNNEVTITPSIPNNVIVPTSMSQPKHVDSATSTEPELIEPKTDNQVDNNDNTSNNDNEIEVYPDIYADMSGHDEVDNISIENNNMDQDKNEQLEKLEKESEVLINNIENIVNDEFITNDIHNESYNQTNQHTQEEEINNSNTHKEKYTNIELQGEQTYKLSFPTDSIQINQVYQPEEEIESILPTLSHGQSQENTPIQIESVYHLSETDKSQSIYPLQSTERLNESPTSKEIKEDLKITLPSPEPKIQIDQVFTLSSKESEIIPSSSSIVMNENVTLLELDEMNFMIANELMNNDKTIISKVEDFECVKDANGSKILLKIGEEVCTTSQKEEETTTLNIHADEHMPPRGELSESEVSNCAISEWGKVYNDQECSSGMSTSYDLLARESWEGSDGSDTEMPPLQSRNNPQFITEQIDIKPIKKTLSVNYSCSTCGKSFGCPKERRVHQTKEHSSSSVESNQKKKIKIRLARKPSTNKASVINIKEENNFEIFAKSEIVMENVQDRTDLSKLDFNPLSLSLPTDDVEIKQEVLCPMCGEMFSNAKDFNKHMFKTHKINGERYKCKTCSESFPSELKFAEHLRIHPLECHICGKNFYRKYNLHIHMKRHQNIRPHKCDTCSKAFLTKQKLQEHVNIHTGNNPIKCTMCDETFKRHSNLVQHRNKHHFNIKKKYKDFVCHCGEVFHSKNKLNWHKEIHDSKPKSCTYCHEKFIHVSSLTRHIRRSHNQNYVPNGKKDENVECPICKGIYFKSSLEVHMQIHSGKRQFSCLICGKEFTTKWNLKLHKWTHASRTSKPFKCEQCNGAFIRLSDFQAHMNSHKAVRPYTCNYCGCKFIRKYNCQRHVREHELGKNYPCTVCNKTFHRSYYLKEHMRVHSGVRPFACHICGKTSTTKSNHNKHMKIHHAREPVSTEG